MSCQDFCGSSLLSINHIFLKCSSTFTHLLQLNLIFQLSVYKTNGGHEYMSNRFKAFLASNDIVHSVSCPYTLQQNRLTERKHIDLVEIGITLLTEASILIHFLELGLQSCYISYQQNAI